MGADVGVGSTGAGVESTGAGVGTADEAGAAAGNGVLDEEGDDPVGTGSTSLLLATSTATPSCRVMRKGLDLLSSCAQPRLS